MHNKQSNTSVYAHLFVLLLSPNHTESRIMRMKHLNRRPSSTNFKKNSNAYRCNHTITDQIEEKNYPSNRFYFNDISYRSEVRERKRARDQEWERGREKERVRESERESAMYLNNKVKHTYTHRDRGRERKTEARWACICPCTMCMRMYLFDNCHAAPLWEKRGSLLIWFLRVSYLLHNNSEYTSTELCIGIILKQRKSIWRQL